MNWVWNFEVTAQGDTEASLEKDENPRETEGWEEWECSGGSGIRELTCSAMSPDLCFLT